LFRVHPYTSLVKTITVPKVFSFHFTTSTTEQRLPASTPCHRRTDYLVRLHFSPLPSPSSVGYCYASFQLVPISPYFCPFEVTTHVLFKGISVALSDVVKYSRKVVGELCCVFRSSSQFDQQQESILFILFSSSCHLLSYQSSKLTPPVYSETGQSQALLPASPFLQGIECEEEGPQQEGPSFRSEIDYEVLCTTTSPTSSSSSSFFAVCCVMGRVQAVISNREGVLLTGSTPQY